MLNIQQIEKILQESYISGAPYFMYHTNFLYVKPFMINIPTELQESWSCSGFIKTRIKFDSHISIYPQ